MNNWKEYLKLVVTEKTNFCYLGHKSSFLSPRIQISINKSNSEKGKNEDVFQRNPRKGI